MNIVLLLLGGKGERFSSTSPKQFTLINEKPLFLYTLENIHKNPHVDAILCICVKEYISYVKEAIKGFNKVINVISGGESRQLSVFEGLKYLKSTLVEDDANILIHDSVRVNVSDDLINRAIEGLNESKAIRPIISMSDSLIDKNGKSVNRDEIFIVQTPQAFKFDILFEAHSIYFSKGIFDMKDDASMMDIVDVDVKNIAGSKLNFKITTKEDLEFLLLFLFKSKRV